MSRVWQYLAGVSADHPVIVGWLVPFLLITVVLGAIHELEIVGDMLIVLVRHGKKGLRGLVRVGTSLKRELTTWKADP